MDEKVNPYPFIWADGTKRPHLPGKLAHPPSAIIDGAVGSPTPVLMRIP